MTLAIVLEQTLQEREFYRDAFGIKSYKAACFKPLLFLRPACCR